MKKLMTNEERIKKAITLDIIGKKLYISNSFYKKACNGNSVEYKVLHQMMNENVGFEIAFKVVEDKKTYKDLTYAVMETYIEESENKETNLLLFNEMKKEAEAEGSGYPLVKKWFLNTFEEFKNKKISDIEYKRLVEKAKARIDAEKVA
ncbi:MAG: hypothetical protein IKU42_05025 [Oscillospiraceae bacterium]|nr:hypothetical protein [Oscillospiraceae bacterium]